MGFPKPRRRTRECRPSASRRLREEAPACAASLQQLAHDNHASRGFLSVGPSGPRRGASSTDRRFGCADRGWGQVSLAGRRSRAHASFAAKPVDARRGPGGCDRPGVASGRLSFDARARIPDLLHRRQVDPIQTPAAVGPVWTAQPRSTGDTRATRFALKANRTRRRRHSSERHGSRRVQSQRTSARQPPKREVNGCVDRLGARRTRPEERRR